MTWGRAVVLPMELEFVGTIKLFLGPEEPGGPGESREPRASRQLGTNREFGDLRTFMVDDSVHASQLLRNFTTGIDSLGPSSFTSTRSPL